MWILIKEELFLTGNISGNSFLVKSKFMDLKTQLLELHNRKNADLIAEWIGANQKRFDELLNLLFHGDFKIAQRASWPFSISAINNPLLIQNHLEEIIGNLKRTDIHKGVIRNTLSIFVYGPIPENFEGEIMDVCFNFLVDPYETIAIKSSSLGILEKLTKKYPEILPELTIVLEDQLPHGSTSFKSKVKGILKRQFK